MDELRNRFEATLLPHIDASYNLARWIVRDAAVADDMVQESLLRALRYFSRCRESNVRPWLLTIVRHTCFAWLKSHRQGELHDYSLDQMDLENIPDKTDCNPETLAIRKGEEAMLQEAIAALPVVFREAIILREFEDLSYREIAQIAGVPIGTVMSRLARARRLLFQSLGAINRAAEWEALR